MADLPKIMRWAKAFHDEAAPPWPWDADAMRDFMAALIQDENGFVAVGRGFVAGMKGPLPISPRWIVAREFLWWGEGDGPALLRAFRDWAWDADEIQYSCRSGDAMTQKFYGRFSEPSEAVFSEVLTCA